MSRTDPSRRALIAAGAALSLLPGAAFAQAPRAQGRKLVLIILRGALDGLAALAPLGERRYRSLRGGLALTGGAEASDGFVFHPALDHASGLYRRGELLALHAAATDYRDRSHFDGQDRLEAGLAVPRDGWLNRALTLMGGAAPGAVAVGRDLPLVLRGAAPAASWAPAVLPGADDDTIARLMDLYRDDPSLGPALARALETDAAARAMTEDDAAMGGGMRAGARGLEAARLLGAAAGNLLIAPGGPDLAVLSLDGWDTHVRQGAETGQLAQRLAGLDAVLSELERRLGPAWAQTAVIVTTEFGRTVRENGAGGTDHGTGGLALLAGGAVRGGRIIGDWPGLDRLYEDRDLYPANDLRALFAAVLSDHWGHDRADLARAVFPGADGLGRFSGLIA
ncbi:MAG: DUF1501 domain-containing protein [Oceanicaulis sp.]